MLTTPTKDDWIRGCLYAIAMGIPLLIGLLTEREILAFVALGALFCLRLDPRSESKRYRTLAMVGGMMLVIMSGMLGSLLVGHLELAILALIIISFLAGQPKPDQSYFSLLAKFMVAALLLEEMGISATIYTALAYFVGAILALALSLVQTRFFPSQAVTWSPNLEWHRLREGDINGPLYGLTLTITILVATLTAHCLHAQHGVWVGLTVLFVMHIDGAKAWTRVWKRIAGTMLGVCFAYLVVVYLPTWCSPLLIMLAALFMPSGLRQNYLVFSVLITMVILLVFDLAVLQEGGDRTLILWRLFDTLIGCAWVAVSVTLLYFWKKYRLRT
ncbi:FUSC family protein [Shewanella sp. D64]|uniref:FUSC family protein n=1 Tax=unclassified Shewanella TaxID=196818 RepID=UPI0022BA52B2|nr:MULTISPECIES: FUSC family protein [unclassified Shewanella]MEC4727854.1 FUSC family protein [Shewanella sp. D64]MEC4739391.1 FUSC family protein [Shewanella sp. E94]WBJ96955.1 FUSC family protein [Shewanella sp. MTB7]